MFTNFRRNEGGNVATMFSVMVTTLIIGIGAAIDLAGLSSHKQDLQDAVDAATLAAARADTDDKNELKAIVRKFILEIDPNETEVRFDIKIVDDEIIVTAESLYDTYIMGFIGKDNFDVAVTSGSPLASKTPIKLSLVLDTTESMSGARLDAMKTAANSMLQGFIDDDADIAVSVIPFGKYVNVGTSRKQSNWLDVTKDGTSETTEVCRNERLTTKARSCKKTGRTLYRDDIRDGVNFGRVSYEEEICTPAEYEYTGNVVCTDRTVNYTWHGCVGSRQSPYNEQADFNGRRINGIMNEGCGTEIQTLTTNIIDAKSKVSSLSTAGNTYVPSGIAWGWRSLESAEPLNTKVKFDSQKITNESVQKIMVIMTDGANTLSQGGDEPYKHDDRDEDDANERSSALCEGAKADGIQIFTIGFRLDDVDAATISMLENCATTKSGFYRAGDAQALKQVFSDIAGQFSFARLTM